jgi:hypothetical protein
MQANRQALSGWFGPLIVAIALTPAGHGVAASAPFTGADVGPETVCVPPPRASIETRHGRSWLSATATTCYSIYPGTGRVLGTFTGGGAFPAGAHPVVLRRGEIARFRFEASPQSEVHLQIWGERGAPKNYRLSPLKSTWRVRGRSGVMVISVQLSVSGAPGSPGFSASGVGAYTARFVVR